MHVRSETKTIVQCIFVVFVLVCSSMAWAASKVVATRVWPAQDYTRITLESAQPLQYNMQLLKNPSRLVLDLKGAELTPVLKTITDKILSSDPYIKQIRVGLFKPDTVRVVVDLKTDIRPELFSLNPAGAYQHRLVLDIYPFDPMMAMLAEKKAGATKPASSNSPSASVKPTESSPADTTKPTTNTVPTPAIDTKVAAEGVKTTETKLNGDTKLNIDTKLNSAAPANSPVNESKSQQPAQSHAEASASPPVTTAASSSEGVETQPLNVVATPSYEAANMPPVKTAEPTNTVPLSANAPTATTPNAGGYSPPSTLDKPVSATPTVKESTVKSAESAVKSDIVAVQSPSTPANKTNEVMTNPSPSLDKQDERLITIVIDAGHGGEDPGARGANDSHEKDITLTIAKKLKQRVDAEPNMRGLLTRDADFFIPLHGRVVKARNLKADLFVSIHADAFSNQSARGSSVFALSEKGATSASARYLAKKENESDLIGGVSLATKDPELARTLLDLSQTATINDSLKLGKSVLNRIGEINKLHKNHVEQAGFAVLKSPDIPSILVETAFISNPEEEARLNDDGYQDQLVNAIVAGIKHYFASNPALAKSKSSLMSK